jgi:RNA polymerase sigma-70 factor (ECF subfamily)
LDNDSDRILVRQVQAGDREAYEVLITRYYRRVYGVCLGIVADPHQSQDLCQEAMLQGYIKIGRLREVNLFGGWITKIAQNLCFDWLRKQKRNRTFMADLADYSEDSGKNDSNDDLTEMITKLPLELRRPLVMYYFDGCNCRSISQQLGVSRSSVCRRLWKAKRCLHELLSEVNHES